MITFLCTLLGLIFLFLPFVPSIIEVLRSTDDKALKITNHLLRDPRASPEFLYWHYAHLLGAADLGVLAAQAKVSEAQMLTGGIFAVPEGRVKDLPKTVSRLLSAGSIQLTDKTSYLAKILSLRSIQTGERNALNEIHAKEKLTLGAGSKIMWWASAEQVVVEDKLDMPGKIQASQSIAFTKRASFLHLESPIIRSVENVQEEKIEFFVETAKIPARNVFKEHCEIKAGETHEGDLIVKGNLTLHPGAKVHGNVKCHQVMTLGKGAQVSGNVVVVGDLKCQGKNWIGGNVLGQKSISFAPNCHVGSENQRVTISADRLAIEAPFRSHGTIRAWTLGTFK